MLFTAVPALGHVVPLLPLALAARRAGHEVAMLTHPSMGEVADPVRVLPAGPSTGDVRAELAAREAVLSEAMPMAERARAVFVDVRIDLGGAEVLAAAGEFEPEIVVADMLDFLGQLVAAERGVPWIEHGHAVTFPPQARALLEPGVAAAFERHDARPTKPVAFVDPWPLSLQRATDVYPAPRVEIRPEPYSAGGPPGDVPAARPASSRGLRPPEILVSMGTDHDEVGDVAGIAGALAARGFGVLVAPTDADALRPYDLDPARVRAVGFAPMHDLLAGVDAVVTAGGAGTVLAALSRGLPLVVLPGGRDKPDIAARVAERGVGRVVGAVDEVGDAVVGLLADPAPVTAAREVSSEIASMNGPDVALSSAFSRAGTRGET